MPFSETIKLRYTLSLKDILPVNATICVEMIQSYSQHFGRCAKRKGDSLNSVQSI